jgi:mono/diheme cytochrome c family protein
MSVSIRTALGFVVLCLAAAGASLAQAPTTFTAEQQARGLQTYTETCSGCHGTEFTGGPGSPSLRGPEFMFTWNGKSAADLYTFIHDNMPPGQQGSLSEVQYTEIVAAILAANGMAPGATPLPTGTAATGVTIKPAG